MSYPQTTSVLSSRKKILRMKPILDFSLANMDATLDHQWKGKASLIHSILLIFLVRLWVTPFLPQPFPRNFAFMLDAFASTTHFSTSSASGLQQACPTLCPISYPLTFLPPTLLPPKSQEWTLFFSLCFLPVHQSDLCRLVPYWLLTPFHNSFFLGLHLNANLLVLFLYFSSSLPFPLSFPTPPSLFFSKYPLADH